MPLPFVTCMMRKKLVRWLKIIVLLYCLIGIALFYFQNHILFHPTVLARDYKYSFEFPFEEVDIPFNKTDTMNMVKFFPADSVKRRGVVLYFHGNRGNVNRYRRFVPGFTAHGYEVWMADYPGYGKSVGERNEKVLYQQALQVYKLAETKYGKDSIIVYGKSFGTGIAAYLASVEDCNQLILETPYYSINALARHYFPIYPVVPMTKYTLPIYQDIQKVNAPVNFFHGTNDEVVPYQQAMKLKKDKPSIELITIEDGKHNNLSSFDLFQKKLDSLLNPLSP